VPGSGTSIAIGTGLDALPEALVLGVSLRAGGLDLALVTALALANVPEALSGTAGMRLASRSSTYVLSLWTGTTLVTAATTAVAFYFVSELGPHATAILKAYGAGALIAMTAETMIPEAFHNGPRYSGVLAARSSRRSFFSAKSPGEPSASKYSRCITGEDKVASFGGLVAEKAVAVHCLCGGFAVVKLSEPPAAGRGVFS
jgi:hypothetical protein